LEDEVVLASAFRKVAGSPIGSDIFFIVKRKKLFAHRVLLWICSDHFHKILKSELNIAMKHNTQKRERSK
jgi:hypothetical protein